VLNAIPATAGSVSDSYIVDVSASKLTGSRTIPKGTMPAGAVLQVVNATYSTQVTTTSSSFVTTNLTASITPTSSTSKIFVIATMPMSTGTANENGKLTIYRNGSNIAPNTGLGVFQTSAVIYAGLTIQLLDSPATTSSTTYAVFGSASGGSTVTFNTLLTGASSSVITLMEIAA
jgi:hypothetical protein